MEEEHKLYSVQADCTTLLAEQGYTLNEIKDIMKNEGISVNDLRENVFDYIFLLPKNTDSKELGNELFNKILKYNNLEFPHWVEYYFNFELLWDIAQKYVSIAGDYYYITLDNLTLLT